MFDEFRYAKIEWYGFFPDEPQVLVYWIEANDAPKCSGSSLEMLLLL